MHYYNTLAKTIYRQNVSVGWWDNPDRCIFETLQLVSTEIAEATEGERRDLNDDHLPHRKMGEVELADALMRLFDMAGRYKWVFVEGLECNYQNWFDGISSIGGHHFTCNVALVKLGEGIFYYFDDESINQLYTHAVLTIDRVAENMDYDVYSALTEKLEFNANRADHKRENREKANGKKF